VRLKLEVQQRECINLAVLEETGEDNYCLEIEEMKEENAFEQPARGEFLFF
jgi:hypothetical protein